MVIFSVDLTDTRVLDDIETFLNIFSRVCDCDPAQLHLLISVNKCDLKDPRKCSHEDLCKYGEVFYTSAKTGDNVNQLFDRAITLAMDPFARHPKLIQKLEMGKNPWEEKKKNDCIIT